MTVALRLAGFGVDQEQVGVLDQTDVGRIAFLFAAAFQGAGLARAQSELSRDEAVQWRQALVDPLRAGSDEWRARSGV